MALTPLQQEMSQKRAQSESAELEQPRAERLSESLIPEEGPASKRQRHSSPVHSNGSNPLPAELLVKVAREIANQPDRSQADVGLTNLRLGNRRMNDSILEN